MESRVDVGELENCEEKWQKDICSAAPYALPVQPIGDEVDV